MCASFLEQSNSSTGNPIRGDSEYASRIDSRSNKKNRRPTRWGWYGEPEQRIRDLAKEDGVEKIADVSRHYVRINASQD